MSDRKVREAVKTLSALSKQKSNKQHSSILSEVSERVKSLVSRVPLQRDRVEQLQADMLNLSSTRTSLNTTRPKT